MNQYKLLYLLLFNLLGYLPVLSQENYEKGYFITIQGERQECLILNKGWLNSPETITYKLEEDTSVIETNIHAINEFGIGDQIKYIKATVDIDLSTDIVKYLDKKRAPNFEKKTVFLKVIIQGKISLYQYKKQNLLRFFYSESASSIEPLIYKRYYRNGLIFTNDYYLQQLKDLLQNFNYALLENKKLKYNAKQLRKLFISYNNTELQKAYPLNTYKSLFNVRIFSGLVNSNFTIHREYAPTYTLPFESKINFIGGLDLEIVFPYFKHKISLAVQPSYHNYQDIKINSTTDSTYAFIKALYIPIGVTYKSKLNNKVAYFVNNSFSINIINDKIKEENWLEPRSDYYNKNIFVNYSIALGLEYNELINITLRRHFNMNLHVNYGLYQSEFSTNSITIGYKIFGTKK